MGGSMLARSVVVWFVKWGVETVPLNAVRQGERTDDLSPPPPYINYAVPGTYFVYISFGVKNNFD